MTRDGRIITVEARWVHLRNYLGHPQTTLVVPTDVTEKNRLEAQRIRSQRIEGIGLLASGIAHDFNNLLNPILMGVKPLQMDRPEEEQQHLREVIQTSAERGAEMAKGLLAYTGDADQHLELLSPAAVIHEVKAILDHTFPKE